MPTTLHCDTPSEPASITLPTSLAVSDALLHYRQIRELTREELAYLLAGHGVTLSAEDLRQLEARERPVTVDELMACAYALEIPPTTLLTHIPIDAPVPEGPLATGLPADVGPDELRAWATGATTLDSATRLQWAGERLHRRRVTATHYDDQLRGAYAELTGLEDLAGQQGEDPDPVSPVVELHRRLADFEHAASQADLALALAEQQLEQREQRDEQPD